MDKSNSGLSWDPDTCLNKVNQRVPVGFIIFTLTKLLTGSFRAAWDLEACRLVLLSCSPVHKEIE